MPKTPRAADPSRAAAYLQVIAARERVFMAMFERVGDVKKAVDHAYIAMKFIEEGDAEEVAPPTAAPEPAEVDEAAPPTPDREDGKIRIGRNDYSKSQIEAFKAAWNDPAATQSVITTILQVSWQTACAAAAKLGLPPRKPSGTEHTSI
ncbi:MAG TPA: hypothetical protein VD994_00485, partial [Prosthecobacter sp.]|nr:hypothetical protein [Prosthecobacter sp.]